MKHYIEQIMVKVALSFSIMVALSVCVQNKLIINRPMNESFSLSYQTHGGFADVSLRIDYLDGVVKTIEVVKNNIVISSSVINREMRRKADLLARINLKNLHSNVASSKNGRIAFDAPIVEFKLKSSNLEHIVTRNYKNKDRFEADFHKAESLCQDIIIMVLE